MWVCVVFVIPVGCFDVDLDGDCSWVLISNSISMKIIMVAHPRFFLGATSILYMVGLSYDSVAVTVLQFWLGIVLLQSTERSKLWLFRFVIPVMVVRTFVVIYILPLSYTLWL
ncbi:hypothetical protein Hanom_Chr02g00149041 [Helianthus anomalus]